jgi:hypothetical protein
METVHLKLTRPQLNNLEVFLSRVNLSATEIGAFQDLIRVLIEAKGTEKNGEVDSGNK